MNKKLFIALSGKRRAGKDMVAGMIVHYLKKNDPHKSIHVLAFADSLKDDYCKSINITRDQLEKDKDFHRANLQDYGAGKRKERADYWIGKLVEKVNTIPDREDSYIIITDCRYRNEADILTYIGCYIWRITNPRVARTTPADLHESERDLDNWRGNYSGLILNNCSLETLRVRVERLCDVWFEHVWNKKLP